MWSRVLQHPVHTMGSGGIEVSRGWEGEGREGERGQQEANWWKEGCEEKCKRGRRWDGRGEGVYDREGNE